MRVVIAASLVSLAAFGAAGAAFAAPPGGMPGASAAAAGGRPDFAGRPASPGSSSGAGYGASSNASSSSRGNSSNAGSFPSNSNAGGNGLSHASPNAQPTLQVLDEAFSEGEISLIREYFTARAHENKPETETSTTAYKRGQKLTAGYLAEPLSAELLAKLPNRPGLTYVRVGDDILLLAGPDDVIVDIIADVAG